MSPSLPSGEGFSEALSDALRYLKTAERTASELRLYLRDYRPETVDSVLNWLSEKKLLSELRAVEAIVRPRTSGKRAESDQRLRERLEAKGADASAIDQSIAGAPGESERAMELLKSRFHEDDIASRPRAGRLLFSRGFDEDLVEAALERFFGSE